MKKGISLPFGVRLLFLLLSLVTTVQAQFTYSSTNGAITITGYKGTGGAVAIPGTINGLPVTSIGDYAFWDQPSLTNVTIPEGVTNIGNGAFSLCAGLTDVNIPYSVMTIGDYAFQSSGILNGAIISKNVKYFGFSAFGFCTNLRTITVDTLNPSYSSVDGVLFNKNVTTLLQYPSGKAGTYAIPESVSTIETSAFASSVSLTSVTISNNVSSIGWHAFRSCSSLGTILVGTLNPFYSSLGGVLFNKSQTELIQFPAGKTGDYTIPNNVTNIDESAFFSCTFLTAITVDPLNPSYSSVEGVLFDKNQTLLIQCPAGKTGIVGIPRSVTGIRNAFDSCAFVTAITVDALNQAYSSLDGALFDKNQTTLIKFPAGKAGNFTIPNSVTALGTGAINYCNFLTNVTIGDGLTSILPSAFYSCANLKTVMIGKNVTNIWFWAFSDCTNLAAVYFQTNAPGIGTDVMIGADVFRGSYHVIAYYLPGTTGWGPTFAGRPTALWYLPSPYTYTTKNGTINITGYTGSGETLTIPNAINGLPVASIGAFAFQSLTGLTNVTMPDTVTSIGDGAFAFCASLISVTIPNNVATIGYGVFSSCSSLTTVTIPDGVTGIGDYAFHFCTSLANVTIPHTVTSLGDYAFYSCTNLTGLHFQGSAPVMGSLVFAGDNNATVYYLPGTTGWGTTLGGRPTTLWLLPNPVILSTGPSFGGQSNGFGFLISWATNSSVVVEACAGLANSTWLPVGTNMLNAGSSYFNDPQWKSYSERFYRIRSP